MNPRKREWIGGTCLFVSAVVTLVGGIGFAAAAGHRIDVTTVFGLSRSVQFTLGVVVFSVGIGIGWMGRWIATAGGNRESYWF